MRDPVPVFVNLGRFKQISEDAFLWACDFLKLDVELMSDLNDVEIEKVGDSLDADLIRFGKYLIVRTDDDIVIWNSEDEEFVDPDFVEREVVHKLPKDNPLRPARDLSWKTTDHDHDHFDASDLL